MCLAGLLIPIFGGSVYLGAAPVPLGLSVIGDGIGIAADFPLIVCGLTGGLCAAALAYYAKNYGFIHRPRPAIAIPVLIFAGLLVLSLTVSQHLQESLSTLGPWLVSIFAFLTATVTLGRSRGPQFYLLAFWIGAVVLALIGIREHATFSAVDPTWRIQAGWTNPNALAGMLAPTFLVGCGLIEGAAGLSALLIGIGNVAIAIAIFFTQSRGGALVSAGPFLILCVIALFQSKKRPGWFLKLVAIGAGSAVLIFAATHSANAAASRLTHTTGVEAESVQFRKNLWKSAIVNVQSKPSGSGIGTYAFESSQPGIVTITQYAHSSWLQLAVECTILAPIFLALSVLTCLYFLIARKRQSAPVSSIAISAAFAILAMCGDNLLESNLYLFGNCFLFFSLLGVLVIQSSDGCDLDYWPSAVRIGYAVTGFLPAFLCLWIGLADAKKSYAETALMNGDANTAIGQLQTASAMVPFDAEPDALLSSIYSASGDKLKALTHAREAAEKSPSPKLIRAYAYILAANGDEATAEKEIKKALNYDPNNLLTYEFLFKGAQSSGQTEEALKLAHDIVAIEYLPYFQVRALSEYVPLDTIPARIYIANSEKTASKKLEYLLPGVELYREYGTSTIPKLISEIQKFGKPVLPNYTPTTVAADIQSGLDLTQQTEVLAAQAKDEDALAKAQATHDLLAKAGADFERALSSSK